MQAKLFITLAAIFMVISVQANNKSRHSSIEVIGTATVEVIPDVMKWRIGIESKDKDLKVVARVHAEIVSKLLTTLKTFDIEKEKTKTSNMSFGEDWKYVDSSRIKIGYKASTTITFSINDFDQYKSLWLKLSSIDTVSVESVKYDYSKRVEIENKLRQKALLNAVSKAKNIVSVLETTTLGEPLTIKEGYRPSSKNSDDLNVMGDDDFGFGGGDQSPIAVGILEIKIHITATFRLITK